MKCKLQQPIKDFIIAILFVLSMFGIIFYSSSNAWYAPSLFGNWFECI